MTQPNLVLTSEHPFLRTQSFPAIIGADTERVIKQLREILLKRRDILSVSAIQIGCPIRLFICQFDPFLKEVINPEILEAEGEAIIKEGCLSVPEVFRYIERPAIVKVKYQRQVGNTVIQTLSGMSARVFQHEIDHLNGKLFIDYPEAPIPPEEEKSK